MLRICLLSLFICMIHGAVDQDEINDLPGLTFKPTFRSYSGFLKATGTKRLHYWFVESQGNPKSDPVVLWLNGGPGCSSVEGLLNEHGPYQVNKDGKTLRENKFAWNRIANVLYVESPAGVGYSYSTDKDYKTSDDQVATDNYWALKNFFNLYPEYANNEFYITGESYGGIYVPMLSVKVLQDKKINFMGSAVGNGALDFTFLDNAIIDFGYSHGLWGAVLMEKLYKNCCSVNSNGNVTCNYATSTNEACQKAVSEAGQIIGSLNIYNLYGECYPTNQQLKAQNKTHLLSPIVHMFTHNKYLQAQRQKILTSVPLKNIASVPPCVDATPITTYMNNRDVRKALHIPDMLPEWAICSGEVGAQYQRQYNTMRNQVMEIVKAGKNFVIYNGDIDMACNFLGDEWFADSLGLPESRSYREWTYTAADKTTQVGGFVKHFGNLVFATVRGAGHMVPQDKPIPAFALFAQFLGKDLFK